jgi:hypothetical protein
MKFRFNRRAASVLIYSTAAASAIACSSVRAFPGVETQLAGFGSLIGLIGAMVAAVIYAMKFRRPSGPRAWLPLAATALLAILAPDAGLPLSAGGSTTSSVTATKTP